MRRISFWVFLLLVLAAASATAHGSFAPLGTISGPGPNALAPQVAVDNAGNSVFTWTSRDGATDCGGSGCLRIRARARTAAGALSAIQTLSPPGRNAEAPGVAVDADGDAVFVWLATETAGGCGPPSSFRIEARARAADGTLSPVQTLSQSAMSGCVATPKVAVDPSGNAVFVWMQILEGTTGCGGSGCFRVRTRARRVNGTLSLTRTLSAPAQNGESPQVAVDGQGNAVFAWSRGTRGIQARARTADGALSEIQDVSPQGQRNSELPELAMNQSGTAVFAWRFNDGTDGCFGLGCLRIQARTRAPNGVLGTPQVLSAPGRPAFRPDVAIAETRTAVFVWERFVGSTGCFGSGCLRIQARARAANGTLSVTQTLSAPGQYAEFPRVAVDAHANAVFAWVRPDGTTGCSSDQGCRRIQARSRAADGTLSPTETLSASGQPAFQPTVAVDPNGGADPNTADAVAAWGTQEGSADFCCYRVQAAVQLAP
jgi:hypothetical protein